MSMSSDDLLSAALALPPRQRAQLAHELLSSLHTSEEFADAEWIDELRRRSREVDEGKVELLDWETVRGRILKRLDAKELKRVAENTK